LVFFCLLLRTTPATRLSFEILAHCLTMAILDEIIAVAATQRR
jgi:hypothetical protein